MTAGVRVGSLEPGDAVNQYVAPEQMARRDIDEQLEACGWVVQDYKSAAVVQALGVAVREVPTTAGPADYVLYVDGQAVGVIEAKKTGMTLTGVEPQTRKYQAAYPETLPTVEIEGALPFGYESTGTETRFTSGLDPVPASRRVFTFHRPETLARWLADHAEGTGREPGLRAGVMLLPGLDADAGRLWPAQEEAIRNLEQSFKGNRPRALIQMATGSGKTFTAANVCYRLLRYTGAQRILFLVGLTATPGKQTFGFFDQNLVMEYGHAQAVADRVNVDFDVFRIRTEITESGGVVPAGFVTEFRDRETRKRRLERVDTDIDYDANQLDKRVVAPDQIRTIVRTLRNSLPEIFPDRERRDDGSLRHVPKTLLFAKDDYHAEDILKSVRQEFNFGNQEAVKITYRSGDFGNKPEDLLQQFRTSYETRIAVTVDMIATGTDVKPIECVVFMRMVRSRSFFEQMKGRGVRVIDSDQLRAVTPDAATKDRFVIVDAVGVTEAELHDTVPMERKRTVSFDKLLSDIGLGSTDPDVVSSVASRLTWLNRRMTAADRAEVEQVAGIGLTDVVRGMVDALDVDRQHEAAAAEAGGDPTPEQVKAAGASMIREAVKPLAGKSALREKLIDVRRSYADIRELANAIKRPPRRWTPDALWEAYETLDKSKVRGSGHRASTDLVSLVRYTLGEADVLVSYPDLVNERFEAWLMQQSNAGRTFSQEQAAYLELIKDRVAANLGIEPAGLAAPPFSTQGGLGKARQLFGTDLDALLAELSQALAA